MGSLQIDVFNPPFVIQVNESDEYLQKLLGYYKKIIERIQNNGALKNPLQVSSLAGIMLCDELYKEKSKAQLASRGNYQVVVTDNSNGCTITKSARVDGSLKMLAVRKNAIVDNNCYEDELGSIDVSIVNGTPFEYNTFDADGNITSTTKYYKYTWSHVGAEDQVEVADGATETLVPVADNGNLPAGIYRLTVSDYYGCSVTEEYSIIQNDRIASTGVATNLIKEGVATGEFQITGVTGGVFPYTITWYYLADAKGNAVATQTVQVGDQTYVVSDNKVTVDGTEYTVVDGKVTIGGTTYMVLSDANLLPQTDQYHAVGLAAGRYSYTITDALGYSRDTSFTISDNGALSAVIEKGNDVNCYGEETGTIIVRINNGAPTYSVTVNGIEKVSEYPGGTFVIRQLAAGNYTVVLRDANGATESATITIEQPARPLSFSVDQSYIACYGERDNVGMLSTARALLTVNGGTPFVADDDTKYYEVRRNNDDAEKAVFSAEHEAYVFEYTKASNGTDDMTIGDYRFVVVDALGCTLSQYTTLVEYPEIVITHDNKEDVSC